MPRQELFVDLLKLKQVIDQLEAEQISRGAPAHRPFRSRNELCKAVAATDWGQAIGLTPVVVALRIDRYSVECKTGVRVRGVEVTVAPVAPGASVAASMASVAAPGAEPDAVAAPVVSAGPVAPVQRRSMYRGIDLEAFVAPFLERGLEISSLASIMTSSLHSMNNNLKIQAAWHDLRERFNVPKVMDKIQEVAKPQDISSVLPLDQVRLPGEQVLEPVFGEPVPTEDEPVFGEPVPGVVDMSEGLPMDDEFIADEFSELYTPVPTEEFDLNPEPVGAVGAGWPEGDFDDSQELHNQESNEFYDPATDERTLDHVQETMDVINQEDEPVVDQEMQTQFLPPYDEIIAANTREDDIGFDPEVPVSESMLQEGPLAEQDGEFQTTEEAPIGPFPEPGLYQNDWPGWESSGESQVTEETPQESGGVFTEDDFQAMTHDDLVYESERDVTQDEFQEQYPERKDPQEIERELEEWLATGEAPPGEDQALYPETFPEATPQDEYLPLDFEGNNESYVYDAEKHDSSMFEVEETDPNETR